MFRNLSIAALLAGVLATTAPAQERYPQRYPYEPQRRNYDEPYRNRTDWQRGRREAPQNYDTRRIWRYSVDTGGWFQDHGRGQWIQHRYGQSSLAYQETDRTRDFVELYDPTRALTVRLYGDMLHQTDPYRGWAPMFNGYWE